MLRRGAVVRVGGLCRLGAALLRVDALEQAAFARQRIEVDANRLLSHAALKEDGVLGGGARRATVEHAILGVVLFVVLA